MANELESRDMFDDFFAPMFRAYKPVMRAITGDPVMKSDVVDKGDDYVVKVDLPGFKKDDLKVDYNNESSVLTISGYRETISDHADKDGNVLSSERSQGHVSRSYRIENVDKDKISAKYDNGVLTVHLQKYAKHYKADSNIKID